MITNSGGVASQMRVNDAVGRFGEQTAARHLEAAGLRIVERNWRAPRVAGSDVRGEIDLVACEGDALVVEVKTRSGLGYGSPAAAVTADKAKRVRRLAVAWLAAHPGERHAFVRFDVVSVVRAAGGVTVEHLRGAF